MNIVMSFPSTVVSNIYMCGGGRHLMKGIKRRRPKVSFDAIEFKEIKKTFTRN